METLRPLLANEPPNDLPDPAVQRAQAGLSTDATKQHLEFVGELGAPTSAPFFLATFARPVLTPQQLHAIESSEGRHVGQ